MDRYLQPTRYIDSDHPDVVAFAHDHTSPAQTDVEKAIAIFYPARDDIRYDPYRIRYSHETMMASYTLHQGRGFCVQKAILLAAAARAVGVPSRLGFADVRNHLATPRLLAALGTDVFIYHGFTELYLSGRWVKATPAFNLALCERFGVLPLDFDGHTDSILQPVDAGGRRHMEYLQDRGSFADLPFELVLSEYAAAYPDLFGPSARLVDGDFAAEAAEQVGPS